jgi:hypothetical protein
LFDGDASSLVAGIRGGSTARPSRPLGLSDSVSCACTAKQTEKMTARPPVFTVCLVVGALSVPGCVSAFLADTGCTAGLALASMSSARLNPQWGARFEGALELGKPVRKTAAVSTGDYRKFAHDGQVLLASTRPPEGARSASTLLKRTRWERHRQVARPLVDVSCNDGWAKQIAGA